MPVQPVRLFGDPVLRTPSVQVTTFDAELRKLVADLTDTMHEEGGAGSRDAGRYDTEQARRQQGHRGRTRFCHDRVTAPDHGVAHPRRRRPVIVSNVTPATPAQPGRHAHERPRRLIDPTVTR